MHFSFAMRCRNNFSRSLINIVGTLTLLEAMLAASVNKFIFSSTCATYGVAKSVPISEDHPQNPINPYGASKLMVERILSDFDAACL
jgi:UDP-glucose 4-epimerase